MRKVIIVAALLAVLSVPDNARAEFRTPETVQEFMSACRAYDNATEEQAFNNIFCGGAAEGVVVTLRYLKQLGLINSPCVPDGTSRGQMMQAFVNWAKDNPKKWQYPGAMGIFDALLKTWPCKK